MGFFTGIMVLGGFLVLSFGVKKGLERVNKFMMTGLLLLIAVLETDPVFQVCSAGIDFIDSDQRIHLINEKIG